MNNQAEIMRLTVGRDLDIIIAERLMGWQRETEQAKIRRLSQYITPDSQGRWWRTPEGGWDINPPLYSSNLVAAFRVVEMMVSRGQAFFLMQNGTLNKVAFGDPASAPDFVVGETMMMAICKAALAAIELPNRSGASTPLLRVSDRNSLD
jgi:hypothetical protein